MASRPLPAPTNGENAALRVEVKNLEDNLRSVRTELRDVRDVMVTKSDLAGISAQITGISNRQDAATQPRYSLLVSVGALILSILLAVGGLAYWPVTRSVDRNELAIENLQRSAVPRTAFVDYIDAVKQIFLEREKQLASNSARILSLEIHDREKIQNIARNSRAVDDLGARFDAISRRFGEHVRDELIYGRPGAGYPPPSRN